MTGQRAGAAMAGGTGWVLPGTSAWAMPAGTALALVLAGVAIREQRPGLWAAGATALVLGSLASAGAWRLLRKDSPSAIGTGWLLVAAAAASIAASVAVAQVTGPAGPGPDPADAALAAYWLLGGWGVLSLRAGHVGGRRIDSIVEALLVTAPLAYLGVVVVLRLAPETMTTGEGMLAVGRLAGHVVLVALAADLVRVQARRSLAGWLVLGGTVWALLAQAVHTGLQLAGRDPLGPGALAATGVAVLWVTATLHPDARHQVEPSELLATPLTRGRVTLVLASVLVGPLVLATGPIGLTGHDLMILTVGAVIVATIAVAYLIGLVEQRARIEYLALHDDLCRIPNRILLADRINGALARAPRLQRRVALLFLDLDRFKTINDSLGHAAGNELLRAAAQRLGEHIREADTVARLGGDEFAVLLPDLDDGRAPVAVAEKVLESFAEPFEVGGRQLFITPSIGVSLFPDDASDAEELLRNADVAMYRAKRNGRNTFELYTREMNAWAHQRLTLENHLHHAIERGELAMYYQPKVELRTGAIVGMEALMRWNHPRFGLIPPSDFIPLAEENGLIVPLGEWALEQACAQTQAWRAAGHPPLTVAVNVSARQFQQQKVGTMVARTLRMTGLEPRALELELTESLALEDPELTTATLEDLRQIGVQCSIDDFGTGYSGLHYLTRFPINRLKIDKYFISEISHGGGNARIVAAVIALAHGLHLEVVAEGVENDEQHRFLREYGCDEMQGFLFSEAVPADRFEQLLTRRTPFVRQTQHLRLVGDGRR